MFKQSRNNSGNDKKKSEVIVTESSDDSIPVVGEEDKESAKLVVEDSLILEPLKESQDIKELNSQTENDESLKELRELATKELSGYSWEKGLVMRARLNQQGNIVKQICLPKERRKQVLLLTHKHFGHLSK